MLLPIGHEMLTDALTADASTLETPMARRTSGVGWTMRFLAKAGSPDHLPKFCSCAHSRHLFLINVCLKIINAQTLLSLAQQSRRQPAINRLCHIPLQVRILRPDIVLASYARRLSMIVPDIQPALIDPGIN